MLIPGRFPRRIVAPAIEVWREKRQVLSERDENMIDEFLSRFTRRAADTSRGHRYKRAIYIFFRTALASLWLDNWKRSISVP